MDLIKFFFPAETAETDSKTVRSFLKVGSFVDGGLDIFSFIVLHGFFQWLKSPGRRRGGNGNSSFMEVFPSGNIISDFFFGIF